MKKSININNIISILGFFITLIGFVVQMIPQIPDNVKRWVLESVIFILIIFLIVILILYFKKRTIIKRKKLIKRGNILLSNTQHSAILFGGDLSWVEDYLETLEKIIRDGKVVEVYFPEEKYNNASIEAQNAFTERIKKLQKIQANVFCFKNDIGLRCIIIDPETFPPTDNLKILVSKRLKRNNNSLKNKYNSVYINSSSPENKERAISYLANYLLIKLIRKKL